MRSLAVAGKLLVLSDCWIPELLSGKPIAAFLTQFGEEIPRKIGVGSLVPTKLALGEG